MIQESTSLSCGGLPPLLPILHPLACLTSTGFLAYPSSWDKTEDTHSAISFGATWGGGGRIEEGKVAQGRNDGWEEMRSG
eukprot:761049-Hanusia_phi.AAC.3